MYKIEPHLHTTYISKCAWMGAAPIVRWYKEAGYDAICVTDHYNRTCFDYAHIDIMGQGDKVKEFLEGYYRVKEEADSCGLKVYEGAELRFDGSENDYLLYGFHHELLADPDKLMREGLAAFAPKYRADGALLIQAHPFREGCYPSPAEYLDGVEVINNNPRHTHHANNELALEYAEKYNLIKMAGSDFHEPGEQATTGIYTETLPADSFEFAALIRSGKYSFI